MDQFKKIISYIIYPILALSLCLNFYLLYTNVADKAVVKVEGQTILTESELSDYLSDSYKLTVVNQRVTDYLLTLEAGNRSISEPTNEQLQEMTLNFPTFTSYSTDIEKHRDTLTEAYYVYEIFKLNGVDTSTLHTFLEEWYGNSDTKLYEVFSYETHDHSHAVEIENLLRDGNSISEVEEQLGIEFFTSYTASMDNLISGGEDVDGATISHDMSSHDIDEDDTAIHDMDTAEQVTTYATGDVFHIMDSEDMQIIQIGDILSMDNSLEHFENLYFAQKYTAIKTAIVNDCKSRYVVSYY